ncbi:uncharacterized protein LOC115311125 [Ixodes scapularis]|uniref:uncharacterized protein LOC115311125 n=1 Tax=Ixodes scapularis TaxID=6945 RepID=UPI001A9E406E|nr:uncharacterized protein LOC115311125 [Ixodes scapularis]
MFGVDIHLCAVDKVVDLGVSGFQFSNFWPLVNKIFTTRGQNTSTNNYLASYCLNGTHGNEAFCQAPGSIAGATCGSPIVFAVPASPSAAAMCQSSQACQSVQPSDPNFAMFLVKEFVCLTDTQVGSISGVVYTYAACYLALALNRTDLTGSPVADQVHTLVSQLLAAGACE